MHHAALDRAGTHDRHLDHQVVELFRAQPRQHRHLRARLDLEHADGVGALDHLVGLVVFGGNGRQAVVHASVRAQQIQRAPQRAEHAQREHVHLHQTDQFQVVLVPLDHGAFGHRRVLHRHQRVQRMFGDHEAAGVLRQVPRETDQFGAQRQQPAHQRSVGIEAAFAQAFVRRDFVVPLAKRGRQCVDAIAGQAEGARHVAHCAAAVVLDRHRGQRGAFATVVVEDVLDHFLAAVVLEIDVDVGPFLALFGDEALEQHADAVRVDRGDAQRVADGGVRRRAAALAQDVARPGEAHQVVDGEEIRFVAEPGDHAQFVFDQAPRLFRHAVRPARGGALLGERAQPLRRRPTRRHQLVRVLVAQLAEVERAALRDAHRLGQQRVRIQRGQGRARTQVALAVGEQMRAGFAQRQALADRGQGVLQRAATARVHVHVAAGHRRHAQALRQLQARVQQGAVVGAAQQFHRQPQALGKACLQPGAVVCVAVAIVVARQPQAQQAVEVVVEVCVQRAVAAFVGAPAGQGDQPAQALVAGQGFGQQHQLGAVLDLYFAADDQRQAGVAGRLPGAHDAGQRAFVGDRQRAVAVPCGAFEQFLCMRGAALEAEVRQAMQFGVVGQCRARGRGVVRRDRWRGRCLCRRRHGAQARAWRAVAHANQPCSISASGASAGANTQARWPWRVRTM